MSMEFTVELYENRAGGCPVRDFLDKLKSGDPDDFAVVVAGLAKLRNREYHRIVAVHGIRNKGRAISARDIETAVERMRDWRTRSKR